MVKNLSFFISKSKTILFLIKQNSNSPKNVRVIQCDLLIFDATLHMFGDNSKPNSSCMLQINHFTWNGKTLIFRQTLEAKNILIGCLLKSFHLLDRSSSERKDISLLFRQIPIKLKFIFLHVLQCNILNIVRFEPVWINFVKFKFRLANFLHPVVDLLYPQFWQLDCIVHPYFPLPWSNEKEMNSDHKILPIAFCHEGRSTLACSSVNQMIYHPIFNMIYISLPYFGVDVQLVFVFCPDITRIPRHFKSALLVVQVVTPYRQILFSYKWFGELNQAKIKGIDILIAFVNF